MILTRTASGLARFRGCVLVPTMGALHAGHAALLRAAALERERVGLPVVVTVFVNPAQFDERSDYDNYPSTLDADAAVCESHGVDCVFAPDVETVYPGFPSSAMLTQPIALPGACVGKGLEDAYRPGHFDGVYRVCARLFELTAAASACFGEKDWQQLILARHLAALRTDAGQPMSIVPVATQREPVGLRLGGLALSSRNVHLREADAAAATSLCRAIRAAQRSFASDGDIDRAERAGRGVIEASGARLEYLDIRDGTTCGPVTDPTDARVLTAARVGSTRLIDNDALFVAPGG